MLFDIAEKYKTNSDAPVITNDYRVLLDMDGGKEDILFCGKNKSGQKIIGSICCEADDKPYTLRYVSIILSDAEFAAFTENRTTGYRELIESKATIFVLDKTVNDEIVQIYELPLSEMPKDYLPLPNFLCPNPNTTNLLPEKTLK